MIRSNRALYLAGMAIAFMWLGLRVLSGSVPRPATQFLLVSLVVFALGLVACGGVTGLAAPVVPPTGWGRTQLL